MPSILYRPRELGWLKLGEFDGWLMIFTAIEYIPNMSTQYGDQSAIVADIVALASPHGALRRPEFLGRHPITPRAVVEHLRWLVADNASLACRIHRDGNGWWQIQNPTEDDDQIIGAYISNFDAPNLRAV
jgi:hypothetical protein